ncbi:hypothetical protein RDABS01_037456 [Bienertia sinuspersici]
MSPKLCYNSNCKVSSSETWKKGWRLRNLDFANLCHCCGSIYEEGRFCETFHNHATGWRCCETCGKRVHCGCIVSIHAFVLLDAGGIECKPNQMCPPRSSSGWLTQYPVNSWIQNPGFGSNGVWQFGEDVLNEPADCLKSGLKTFFEVDMSTEFERLFLSEHGAVVPSERNQIQNWSFSDGSLKHNGTENPGYVRVEEPRSCHMHLGHQTILKDGQFTVLSESALSSPLATRADNEDRVCNELSQHLNFQDQIAGKQLCAKSASSPNVDCSLQSQLCNLKPVETRIRKDLLLQYWPKISNEESLQMSGSTHSVITPLFEKRLSASDVGRAGRLLLPKKCAETHFPSISQPEGLPFKVQDINGKEWTFQFRFWFNNNSRIYVLEGIHTCTRSLQLQAGDTVNKASGRSSSIPIKRKNSSVNSIRKHSRVDSMDFLGVKVTLEEAQVLFRSPLSHAPHVVVIEDFEFEEYEDAPVIGRPTMIVKDSLGKNVQWAQCDNCLKWRKLPFPSLLPARFTCVDNVWDNERSSCEVAQELSVKQLKDILAVNYTEPNGAVGSKDMQDAELDAHASENSTALNNFAPEFCLSSSQLTTKHPRHKLAALVSCAVSLQVEGQNTKRTAGVTSV